MKTTKTTSESANRVINLIDYSEKSFAAVGDTKAVKLQLMQLGGKFNPALRCGAGWIFSKKRLAQVTKVLGLSTDLQACPEQQPVEAKPQRKPRRSKLNNELCEKLDAAADKFIDAEKKKAGRKSSKKAAETTLALAL